MDEDKTMEVELSGNITDILEALGFIVEHPGWITEEDGSTLADLKKNIEEEAHE